MSIFLGIFVHNSGEYELALSVVSCTNWGLGERFHLYMYGEWHKAAMICGSWELTFNPLMIAACLFRLLRNRGCSCILQGHLISPIDWWSKLIWNTQILLLLAWLKPLIALLWWKGVLFVFKNILSTLEQGPFLNIFPKVNYHLV